MTEDTRDPTLDYYADRQQPQQPQNSWLPPGATLNPDGSVTMPGGNVVAAPPPGYQRDPNTGVITRIPGNVDNPDQGRLDPYQQVAPTGPTSSPSPNPSPNQQPNGKGILDPKLYTPYDKAPPTYQKYTPLGFPTPPKPPAFSYADFKAPTLEEASKQPGYQFGLQQGEQALQQSRAAQGLLRTGGTLKDILDYGRSAATQNYSNVLNQDLGIYNTNRAGAVQAYNTNYKTQYEDQYTPQLLKYQTESASGQHEIDAENNRAWQQYLNDQDVFYKNQDSPFNKYLALLDIGKNTA